MKKSKLRLTKSRRIEKKVMKTNVNTNQKQLTDVEKFQAKLHTHAQVTVTQKEMQCDKEKLQKLQDDTVLVQERIDQHRQTVSEAKEDTDTNHKQLGHEKETVKKLTHSLDHDKSELEAVLQSEAVELQKLQSEVAALQKQLVQENQAVLEAKAYVDTTDKEMEQQKEAANQLYVNDDANQRRLARTKQIMAKLHQRLAREKQMVLTLRTDADATQKLLALETENVKTLQAGAEANRKLRDREKQVLIVNADAVRKQLAEAKELVAKLRTTAEVTQKEMQNDKEKLKKLQTDAVVVRDELDQEKQAIAEAKVAADMTHKRLEHEKETVRKLTHSLRHVKSELEAAVLKAADTSKLNRLQLQQAGADVSRRILLAETALKTEHSRAVAALEAASAARELNLDSVYAQKGKAMADAHREEVAKLDDEAHTVTRQLRRELADVSTELDAQTNRANAATLVTKQAYAIAKARKQEIMQLQQTERKHCLAITTQKRKEIELTHSLAFVCSELKHAVGNAAKTNKLHSVQLQELDGELYTLKLQKQKANAEISRRTVLLETSLKEEHSRAVTALEATAVAREQDQTSKHAHTEKALKDAHRREVARLDAKMHTVTCQLRRELTELDSARKKQIIAETSRANTEALSAKQARAAAKEYEQKIVRLQQTAHANSLSMAAEKQKEVHLTQQLRSELDDAVLKAADTSKLNRLQLQQAAADISSKIVLAETALKTEHSRALVAIETASVARQQKQSSAHSEKEKAMVDAHRQEVAMLNDELHKVTRELHRELAEVSKELDAETNRANTATEKYEQILMSEYKSKPRKSLKAQQKKLHHLAYEREQAVQNSQEQWCSTELQKLTKHDEESRNELEAKRRANLHEYRFETQEKQEVCQQQVRESVATTRYKLEKSQNDHQMERDQFMKDTDKNPTELGSKHQAVVREAQQKQLHNFAAYSATNNASATTSPCKRAQEQEPLHPRDRGSNVSARVDHANIPLHNISGKKIKRRNDASSPAQTEKPAQKFQFCELNRQSQPVEGHSHSVAKSPSSVLASSTARGASVAMRMQVEQRGDKRLTDPRDAGMQLHKRQKEISHLPQRQVQQTTGDVGIDITISSATVRGSHAANSRVSSQRLGTQKTQWNKARWREVSKTTTTHSDTVCERVWGVQISVWVQCRKDCDDLIGLHSGWCGTGNVHWEPMWMSCIDLTPKTTCGLQFTRIHTQMNHDPNSEAAPNHNKRVCAYSHTFVCLDLKA